jgi:hypothetical protein
MQITMSNGQVYKGGIDVAPGFPGNPLTESDHKQRFLDCIDFASEWFLVDRADEIIAYIQGIESEADVRSLITLLNKPNALETSLASKRHH